MSRSISVRRATADDRKVFVGIFRSAVSGGAEGVMTPSQITAWTSVAEDADAFGERMLQATAWIADLDGRPAGFATLHEDGRVGMLYVRGDSQRHGVGVLLLRTAIDAAERAGCHRMYAEASVFSHPVFLRCGFHLTGTEPVTRAGQTFTHYLVARELAGRD